jgi:hypothetical protein
MFAHLAKLVENSLMTAEIRKIPHLLYLQDLAPSDFYLFSCLRQIIAGQSFSSTEAFLSAIAAILDGNEKSH